LPLEAAKFEQALSIETSDFDVFASGIAAEKVFKPYVIALAPYFLSGADGLLA
jgi:hypothetical protein